MKLIGRGATAEVFDCGDGTVCKLFMPGCPVDAVKREYDAARTFFLLAQGELPQDVQSTEETLSIRKRLAALYLEKMQLDYQEIEGYLCIIRECRKYETPPARKEV